MGGVPPLGRKLVIVDSEAEIVRGIRLFRNPEFVAGNAAGLLAYATLFGVFF